MVSIINYYGRTGAGKSTIMKNNVLQVKGRHLLVVPRKQSIEECYADLKTAMSRDKLNIPIIPFLRDSRKNYNTKIAQEIMDRAATFASVDDHCCLIITQAAFQQLEIERLHGWHLKLDELLSNGNPSGTLFAPVTWPGLANLVVVEPLTNDDRARGIPDKLRRIRCREEIEAKDVLADGRLNKEDQNLFQRASSPIAVYTDATCIEDIGQRRCWWGSPWTLDCVEAFASVEIAACDIEDSLMHLISPRAYTKIECPTKPSLANIRLFYFDQGTATCSAAFWQEPRGRRNLILIAKEIVRRGGTDYWSCNESAESILKPMMPKTCPRRQDELDEVDGTWITQQQDGSNRFRMCTSCAILISAKAQDHEAIFAKLNPAATKTAISRGRETGLIFQFVTRGAIRHQEFSGDYIVYVYDRQQAEALKDKLVAYGFADTAIEHVALDGFEDRVREPRGRKFSYATPEDRKQAQRKQNAERQRRHRRKKKEVKSA